MGLDSVGYRLQAKAARQYLRQFKNSGNTYLQIVIDIEPLWMMTNTVSIDCDSGHDSKSFVEIVKCKILNQSPSVRFLKSPTIIYQSQQVSLCDWLRKLSKNFKNLKRISLIEIPTKVNILMVWLFFPWEKCSQQEKQQR